MKTEIIRAQTPKKVKSLYQRQQEEFNRDVQSIKYQARYNEGYDHAVGVAKFIQAQGLSPKETNTLIDRMWANRVSASSAPMVLDRYVERIRGEEPQTSQNSHPPSPENSPNNVSQEAEISDIFSAEGADAIFAKRRQAMTQGQTTEQEENERKDEEGNQPVSVITDIDGDAIFQKRKEQMR